MRSGKRIGIQLIVPVAVTIYLVLFWRSVSDMPLGGAGVPRLLVAAIASLLVVIVAQEVVIPAVRASRDTGAGAESAGPDKAAEQDWESQPFEGDPVQAARLMATVVVFLCGYWALLATFGAYPSTALFVAGLALALGYRRWVPIAVSVVSCLFVVWAFIRIFTLPLEGFGSWFG